MTDFYNIDHGIPCVNPECKSYGRSHPNCRCTPAMRGMTASWFAEKGTPEYSEAHPQKKPNSAGPAQRGVSEPSAPSGPGHEGGMYVGAYAKGGNVGFCSFKQAHHPDCEYYSEGGETDQPETPANLATTPDNPLETVGHVGSLHGLLHLLGDNLGHASSQFDKEKNDQIIEHAKEAHTTRGLSVAPEKNEAAPRKTAGHKLGDSIFEGDHSKSADILGGTPLVGSVGGKNLEGITQRLSGPLIEKPANSEAFRSASDYLHHSIRGSTALDDSTEQLFSPGRKSIHEPDKEGREALKTKLDSIDENPNQLLDVGGTLGHYLPEHAAAIGATTASAVNYFKTLKPTQVQSNPLDTVSPVDKIANAKYNRQLDIAQKPLLIMNRVKDGTLQAQDMTTLKTIYPELHKSMVKKVTEGLIDAKSKNMEIPYRQKIGMSLFLGQPLDSTMTQSSMAAIIASSRNVSPNNPDQKKPPNAQAMKAINKATDEMATPLQKHEIGK